jgi:hypothetical protein
MVCAQGKNVKKPLPSSDSKEKGVLDLIHSDVCGPMSTTSLSGGEFTSSEFKEFCREVGIKRELSTPYNPQQKCVAERKNRQRHSPSPLPA